MSRIKRLAWALGLCMLAWLDRDFWRMHTWPGYVISTGLWLAFVYALELYGRSCVSSTKP